MKKQILDNCLGLLVELREKPVSVMGSNGRFDGYIEALLDCQRINIEEWQRLYSLSCRAFAFSGLPFPNAKNAGPVMPIHIARLRNVELKVCSLNAYIGAPHDTNCPCSVFWSARHLVGNKPVSRCADCVPPSIKNIDGHRYCQPAVTCSKHQPTSRPAKYWSTVYDSGKPTPFLPLGVFQCQLIPNISFT